MSEAGVFCFGLLMGLIWPLTIGWLLATLPPLPRRPTKQEKAARLAMLADQNEHHARGLGIGP